MNITEQNIRLAAIKLISRNGYESMSLRQLAAKSGTNSSTLYIYYKGKGELLLELIREYQQELSSTWNRCCPATTTTANTKLLAFITCHMRYHLEHQDQARLGNLELRSLDEQALQSVRQIQHLYLKELQGILEQGVTQGSLSCAEPKLMARTLFNMLTHACIWYQADTHWAIDDCIRHYSHLVLKMLGASQAPAPRQQTPPPIKQRRSAAVGVHL